MALDDLQFSYRGLTFGAGTDIFVNRAEGFEGFDSRTSDADLPRGDGAIRGTDYVGSRTVSFELAVIELTGGDTTYEQYWQQVRATFAPSPTTDYPLTFKRPGMPERVIWCRPVQLQRSEDYKRFNTVGFPPVVLRAADPRIYASDAQSLIVPVYSVTSSAFELPSELPFDFSGGTQIEQVAVNGGTADAYPLIRFFSPTEELGTVYYPDEASYPDEGIYPVDPDSAGGGSGSATGQIDEVTLTNTTTGQVLQVEATIVGGQILICDMQAAATGSPRLIVSVDGSSRYGAWKLPRDAFALAPGSNTLRFQVRGTASNARCHLSWSDTWLA